MIISYGGINAYIPNAKHILKSIKNESLFVYGYDNEKQRYNCFGIGTVWKVEKGERVDLVYMNFGKITRPILVTHNHARRQIYSLKRGQLAWFYGFYKYAEGHKKLYLYAKGLQAWYVPKALDIKNYDLESIDEMETKEETDLINFLDQFEEK